VAAICFDYAADAAAAAEANTKHSTTGVRAFPAATVFHSW